MRRPPEFISIKSLPAIFVIGKNWHWCVSAKYELTACISSVILQRPSNEDGRFCLCSSQGKKLQLESEEMGRRTIKVWLIFWTMAGWVLCLDQTVSSAQIKTGQEQETLSIKSSFAQATTPRIWQFPRDHGRHPEFRTEWWYFTGNLQNKQGRRFGYQLTFFRTALSPEAPARTSRWAFRDAYIGHFTITDVEQSKFYYDQRIARGALHMADACADSLEVHIGEWSAKGGNAIIALKAEASFGSIGLQLVNKSPPVLHGENGLARKSHLPEEASYYYSLPHLSTSGNLRLADQFFQIEGLSWMDHEFFTGPEKSQLAGWDWMSLHLSDSTAIMLYLLRAHDGKTLPQSGGTIISANASPRTLRIDQIEATPLAWWASPKTGGKYPIRWRIKISDYQLDLTTPVENQELDTRATTGVIYWEGFIEAAGQKGDHPLSGQGYLEMTGYARSVKPDL